MTSAEPPITIDRTVCQRQTGLSTIAIWDLLRDSAA